MIKIEDGKLIVELREVSEKFNKNHYDLLKSCKKLIQDLPDLAGDIIKAEYQDSRGRSKPTYHLTQKGFSILCMGFNGRKALQWKSKFYDEFEHMKVENKLLREVLTDILRPELNGGKNSVITSRILTTDSIVRIVEHMKVENKLHKEYVKLLSNRWDNTVCITDICCKFKDLSPSRANQLLENAGMLEHRASGWYPNLNYNGSDMLVSATAVNPYTNKLDNYVRYTPKGYEYVYNYLINAGEEKIDF